MIGDRCGRCREPWDEPPYEVHWRGQWTEVCDLCRQEIEHEEWCRSWATRPHGLADCPEGD